MNTDILLQSNAWSKKTAHLHAEPKQPKENKSAIAISYDIVVDL